MSRVTSHPCASTSRILFHGSECRSESKVYVLPVFANEMLGRFFAVLGKPSQEDVEELARAAGEAAVFKVPATTVPLAVNPLAYRRWSKLFSF